MNTIDIVLQIYKNELAQANEQKVIAQAKCEEYRQRIEQLENEMEELKNRTEGR